MDPEPLGEVETQSPSGGWAQEEATVYTRQTTIRQAHDIDGSLAYWRDHFPFLSAQHGFRGLTISADREGSLIALTSNWATKEDLDASETAVANRRGEQLRITGGLMTVEAFELATEAIARPPLPGNLLVVTRASMDPACVHGQIARFERELMPAITARCGFSFLRLLTNRDLGSLVLGIVWQDALSLKKHMEAAKREREVAYMQGVRIDEVSSRQILFVHVD